MAFNSLSEFLAMGSHGFYVWMAFIVSIALLKFLFFNPFIQQRKFLIELHQQLQREETQKAQKTVTGNNV